MYAHSIPVYPGAFVFLTGLKIFGLMQLICEYIHIHMSYVAWGREGHWGHVSLTSAVEMPKGV